jgi:DNA-binding transcriptional MocR family regulator
VVSDDKERLAAWMMRQGFATGHGDTAEELLDELSWQIAEIKARRDELLEALEELFSLADDASKGGGTFTWRVHKARAAIAEGGQ